MEHIWKVGKKKFTNKLQAIFESHYTNKPIYFKGIVWWNHHDWTKQPTESFEKLCLDRAVQISKTHDKVTLYYSGGSDSHTILKTFVDYNLPLHEIIICKSGILPTDFEIDGFAIPYLRQNNLLDKTRVITHTVNDYKNFYGQTYWYENLQGSQQLQFRLQQYWSLHEEFTDTNEKNAKIFGGEKPRVCHVNDKWYTYNLDIDHDARATLPGQIDFYTEDSAISSKQAHMVRDYIVANVPSHDWNRFTDQSNKQYYKDYCLASGRTYDATKSFITKNSDDYDTGGFKVHNFKEKSSLKEFTNSMPEIVTQYKKQIIDIGETYGKFFNKGLPQLGPIGSLSKFYGLDQPETTTVDHLFPQGFHLDHS